MDDLKKGERVWVKDLRCHGMIINVRDGKEYGGIIYTISLDYPVTPDGLYYARPGELSLA